MTRDQADQMLQELASMVLTRPPLSSEALRHRRRLKQIRFAFDVSLGGGTLQDELREATAEVDRWLGPHWRRLTDDRAEYRRLFHDRIAHLRDQVAAASFGGSELGSPGDAQENRLGR